MKLAPGSILRISALGLYSYALRLYPAAFRERYHSQMIYAAHLQLEETRNLLRTCLSLAGDIAISLPGEHWRAATPASAGYSGAFAFLLSAMVVLASIVGDGLSRRSADRQPQSLVASMRDRIAHGANPLSLMDGPPQEIANRAWLESAQPFIGLYDDTGKAIAGSATLRGRLPQPPSGIFRFTRVHGKEKVTWQPDPKIRVALTVEKLSGGGFLLAGQSIVRTETQEIRMHMILIWVWLGMMVTVAVVHLFSRRGSDVQQTIRLMDSTEPQ
jgi:hypothetical protein